MLILKQFDVRLIRLQHEHLELVRTWRNQAHVSNQMVYRKYITVEMQENWFQSINNAHNYYFLIEYNHNLVGLINAKNYDPKFGFGEGGIFIGEKQFEDSFAAVFASLTLLNFVFYFLSEISHSVIKILKTNSRAIQYNKLLGYQEKPGAKFEHDQLYILTKDRFIEHGLKLNKTAKLFSKGSSKMELIGNSSKNNLSAINDLLEAKTPPKEVPGL